MPVHLGAMPLSVATTLRELGPLSPGDIAILNDPYAGGTHLPDITLMAPVHADHHARLLGYVAARAHHSDVGGSSPGSMPLANEIYQEGLRIPPLLLSEGGSRNRAVLRLILANVRTPEEREGDLDAQQAALYSGAKRLRKIADRRGEDAMLQAMEALLTYGDRLLRAGLALVPDGRYEAESAMEDDGFGSGPVPIRLSLEIAGGEVLADFSGSAAQTRGGINAVEAITTAATRYVVRCVAEDLLGTPLPAGGGAMEALSLELPEASVVNAAPPASVAAGNVETSQRITDVLLLAFAQALPDRVPALSQGTMNNITVGGRDERTGHPFTYYETIGGGIGAGPDRAGLSGVHSHMTNSLNTPIEALEHAYPLRVLRHSLRTGSGGSGRHAGGDGIARDLLFLCDAEVTLLSERRKEGPPGMAGGGAGAPGEDVLTSHGETRSLPGKGSLRVKAGDVLGVRTPGGGGWGPAPSREGLGTTPGGSHESEPGTKSP